MRDERPVYLRVRRMPPRHNDLVRKDVEKMLKAGIIVPSSLALSFSVVIAITKVGSPLSCVNYR